METALVVTGLSKKILGKPKLENINFEIATGSITTIMGRMGSGQSLILQIILQALQADSGKVTLFGTALNKRKIYQREEIGIVFSDLAFNEEHTVQQVLQYIKFFYKHFDSKFVESKREALAIPRFKKFRQLPRPIQIKFSLLLALAHKPRLLLLEESLDSLDDKSKEQITQLLGEYMQNKANTILLTSSNAFESTDFAQEIIFLHRGKIILKGSKNYFLDNFSLVKCGETDFANLDKKYFLYYKKIHDFILALSPDRSAVTEYLKSNSIKYAIDNATLEDILALSTRGDTVC